MGSFAKATKRKAKLRAAFFGPSGAGKTMSALRIAAGLGQRIALIDTEHYSASKYADRFEFDTVDLADKTITGYCQMIREAGSAGYEVLIIDSLSHAWQELLESVEKLAKTKYKGNTWSAWSEGTPEQRRLIEAILTFPGHVIATMRSKTAWETSKDERGRSTPQRVGLAPEQGKGIEYEFDLLLELSEDHHARVLKDRTGRFQDRILEKPGEDFGRELADWLNTGADAPAEPAPSAPQERPRRAASRPPAEPTHEARSERGPSWPEWSRGYLVQVQKAWRTEMQEAGVDPAIQQELFEGGAPELVNLLVSRAIESGKLDRSAVAKPGHPDKRDPARAAQWVAGVFASYPDRCIDILEDQAEQKREELRRILGMTDSSQADRGEAYEEALAN